MPAAPLPLDEASRLQSLHHLGILDTPPDAEFDAIVRAASLVCDVPMSLISLVDEHRQWFKANVGHEAVTQTPRELAFCGYTILDDDVLEITDATADARVSDNPLVAGAPGIRFYAGAPLRLSDGARVGTLCVIDRQPRKLDARQIQIVTALAEATAKALEGWRDRQYQARLSAELASTKERLHRHYKATHSDRSRLEKALREADQRETALFSSSSDSLSIIRGEEIDGEMVFRFEALSPAFATVTGWRVEDFVGQRLQDCLPRESARAAARECTQCLQQNTTVPFAVTLDTPKGKRDYEGSRTPIRMSADAKIVRIATAMRDVTERKRLETAELHGQKMEAIGRLAAGVAHDFNNILQSITASLELAQDEMVPGSVAHDHAAIGLRAASRGSYLTHHLLSYARKQLLRPLVIELPNLLKDVEKLLARTLGPNIAVTVRADLSLPTVRTDPGQLQTALLNLAINASHAMPCGGTLLIESRSVIEEGRNWVCLSVSDTGTGMDAATLARATEPFFTTKGVNGSGLGLSMVHGFAEQSGGRIRITSMLGHGTTVAILLPAAAEPVHAPAPPACQPNHTTAKVLLVDDDSDVLVTTGAFLEKAGFATIRAANADLALALLADGAAVDAIVTDYAMPGMNGSDLIHEARLARPGLPGVLISGFTELTDMGPLCEATITLQKPFQREALVTALRRLLAPDTCQPQTCPDALE